MHTDMYQEILTERSKLISMTVEEALIIANTPIVATPADILPGSNAVVCSTAFFKKQCHALRLLELKSTYPSQTHHILHADGTIEPIYDLKDFN